MLCSRDSLLVLTILSHLTYLQWFEFRDYFSFAVMWNALTCCQTTLKVGRGIVAWHGFISFGRNSFCNGTSPVKKSTDDPDCHKQLNHQGQVDFPYETCSERKTQTVIQYRQKSLTVRAKRGKNQSGCQTVRQVSLFILRNISKLFSIHQARISSCHLEWFVLCGRGRAGAGCIGDQATIFNFKSISRKHCQANKAVNIIYSYSTLTSQTKTYVYHIIHI